MSEPWIPPKASDAGTLFRRVYLGAPAEEVWLWLVEPERVREWSLADLMQRPLAPGGPVQYFGRLGGQLLADGAVLEIVEERRLVHTFQFQFDRAGEELEEPSRVAWDLIRHGERMCCLEMRHSGMDPDGETLRSLSASRDVELSSLKTVVETGHPLPWPSRPGRQQF